MVVVPPGILGAVHGRVGVAHQSLGIESVVRVDAHADAGRGHELAVVDDHRDLHRFQDLVGDLGGVLDGVDLRHEERELVATEAGHGVSLAHAAPYPLGGDLDELVTDGVAEGIVDVFQPVEVDEHHRDLVAGAMRLRDRDDEPVDEQRPVRQPGQRVVIGEVLDFRAGQLGGLTLVFEQAGDHAHGQH